MENEKKKRDPRNAIMIVLIIVAAAAIAVAVWALSTRSAAPAPAPRLTPKPTPTEEPLTKTIALPQFAWLNLKADTTEQTLTFDNAGDAFQAPRGGRVSDRALLRLLCRRGRDQPAQRGAKPCQTGGGVRCEGQSQLPVP